MHFIFFGNSVLPDDDAVRTNVIKTGALPLMDDPGGKAPDQRLSLLPRSKPWGKTRRPAAAERRFRALFRWDGGRKQPWPRYRRLGSWRFSMRQC